MMRRIPGRELLRFSLRTLVLGFLVAGIWLGVWGNRARQQASAVRSIVASGGDVHYEFDIEINQAGGTGRIPESPIRQWAGKTIGDDLCRRVSYVHLSGNDVDNADLIPASKLTRHLEGLSCEDTLITDDGLSFVRGNQRIECISLRESGNITDATLETLADCTQLRCLYLSGTSVTDLGLKNLHNLSRLRELELNDTSISDQGLKELENLKNLRILYLRGTKVTDSGLHSLARLNLSSLSLTGSDVSRKGVQELQALMPKCKVSR